MVEEVIEFNDLPEDEPELTERERFAQRMPCEPNKVHSFWPYEDFCLCGVLERGISNHLPWVIAVWPTVDA